MSRYGKKNFVKVIIPTIMPNLTKSPLSHDVASSFSFLFLLFCFFVNFVYLEALSLGVSVYIVAKISYIEVIINVVSYLVSETIKFNLKM